MMRRNSQGIAVGLAGALACMLAAAPARAETRTLQQALGLAYSTNPTLLAERANLRATDENVPAALAGWRPQVSFAGTAGYSNFANTQLIDNPLNNLRTKSNTSGLRGVNS